MIILTIIIVVIPLMILVIVMVPVKHVFSSSLDGQKRPCTCSEAERAEMKGRNASGLRWRPLGFWFWGAYSGFCRDCVEKLPVI